MFSVIEVCLARPQVSYFFANKHGRCQSNWQFWFYSVLYSMPMATFCAVDFMFAAGGVVTGPTLGWLRGSLQRGYCPSP